MMPRISDPGLFDLGIPVLGICYGAQLMMQQLGGRVEKAEKREFGKAELAIHYTGGLFAGLETGPDPLSGLDEPWRPGRGGCRTALSATATSGHSPFAALRHTEQTLCRRPVPSRRWPIP